MHEETLELKADRARATSIGGDLLTAIQTVPALDRQAQHGATAQRREELKRGPGRRTLDRPAPSRKTDASRRAHRPAARQRAGVRPADGAPPKKQADATTEPEDVL